MSRTGNRWTATALFALAAIVLPWIGLREHHGQARADVAVIVSADDGRMAAAERAVRDEGGTVVRRLSSLDTVTASVPGDSLDELAARDGVRLVAPDVRMQPAGDTETSPPVATPMGLVREATGADALAARKVDGSGVDVAVVDTGIAPVAGLDGNGQVVNGPDFSSTADDPDLRNIDAFGHGTHLAGIIGGRTDTVRGVAPGARLVNVKVADPDGSTTLSALMAGIDWTIRNHDRGDLNIRVLTLAFGLEPDGEYRDDPLAFALERAWQRGLVVVAAAGNGGSEAGALDSPAADPYLIAVGADDLQSSAPAGDDIVPGWSSRGDGVRNPDVVAPGTSIVSLRVPGSFLDEHYPEGREGEAGFRGSGTSMAAAVVAGLAALLVDDRPGLDPDEVKALLRAGATPVPGTTDRDAGTGRVDVAASSSLTPVNARQRFPRATLGRLVRGSDPVGPEFAGEDQWSGNRWSGNRWSGNRWSGNRWSGNRWSGNRWSGNRWSGNRWSGNRWSGNRWSGNRWSGNRWSGNRWSGTWATPTPAP